MHSPSAAPRHGLSALRAVLGRPARYRIDARPGDRDQPVTTGVVWACGCSADGSSYHELTLAPCAAHGDAADDPSITLHPPG